MTTPRNVREEIDQVLAYCQGPKPSREKLATGLRVLAQRVEGGYPVTDKSKKNIQSFFPSSEEVTNLLEVVEFFAKNNNRLQFNLLDLQDALNNGEAKAAVEAADAVNDTLNDIGYPRITAVGFKQFLRNFEPVRKWVKTHK